jgi:hypothetical protein
MQNNLLISKQLRKKLGSAKGYQILKIRRPRKKVPDWVNDEDFIRALLLKSFPGMFEKTRERARAARWVRIIYLYFRLGWSRGQIAEEFQETYSSVDSAIRGILRVARGTRCDGRGKLTELGKRVKTGKTGRPRKVTPVSKHIMEG